MTRREAVRQLVQLADDVVSVMEVTAQLAVHCESHGHEWSERTNACAWCGEPCEESDK